MSLSSLNFDNISESDLIKHIFTGVPEGILVDYKREMYGPRNDADAKEFLKDVSSFANTSGGHLIIGMDEGPVYRLRLLALNGDSDQDLQWLENLARDGIKPRISGTENRVRSSRGGGYIIILRIPKSWSSAT